MAEPPPNPDQHSDTGEFVTDEFDRAMFANQPVRRRRRRKSTKSKAPTKLIRTIGVALFCATLIVIGVLLGLNYQSDNLQEKTYHCQYTLGDAEVVVVLPTAIRVNGEYRAPRARAHAIIGHSDQNEKNFITVSAKGFIEMRAQGNDQPLIVINP
jgi:hypothetical protein